MTYKYNPFWQQRIRETVRHALNVHPRLTALRDRQQRTQL